MPQTEYYGNAAGGVYEFFGNDFVDGWPIGPIKILNHQAFFHDPHAGSMQRLRILAQVNAGLITASAPAASALVQPVPGTQNAWFRQGSGIPGQETE